MSETFSPNPEAIDEIETETSLAVTVENVPDTELDTEYDEISRYWLDCGNKVLRLSFYCAEGGECLAASEINNQNDQEKTPGATTAIYTKVREIVQKEADLRQKPVSYQFSSEHPSMILWARTKGFDLFQFDFMDDGLRIQAGKQFFPRPKEELSEGNL